MFEQIKYRDLKQEQNKIIFYDVEFLKDFGCWAKGLKLRELHYKLLEKEMVGFNENLRKIGRTRVTIQPAPREFCIACVNSHHEDCGAQVSSSGIKCDCQTCWG